MNRLCYLFVVSSLNHPIYRQVHHKRKYLLTKYNIPYTVLINADESKLLNPTPTLLPLEDDEILYPISGYEPYMTQKFLYAVKLFFRSFASEDDIPQYIIRINATVYVHFPELSHLLQSHNFPKDRVLAGYVQQWPWHVEQIAWHHNEKKGVNGMIMIFSKDVLLNVLKDPRIYSKKYMALPDDVALSQLAAPYCEWYDLYKNLYLPLFKPATIDKDGNFLLDKIKPVNNNKWIFRIRNDNDPSRSGDLRNWDQLLRYYDEDVKDDETFEPTFTPVSTPVSHKRLYTISLTLLIILLFIYIVL